MTDDDLTDIRTLVRGAVSATTVDAEGVIRRAQVAVRRRRRRMLLAYAGVVVLAAGGVAAGLGSMGHDGSRAQVVVMDSPTPTRSAHHPQAPAPAVVSKVVIPAGWITRNDVISQLPTTDGTHVTDRDIRYAPRDEQNEQEIELDLQTGDVSAPSLAALSGLEPTAHVSTITRPGASPLILERDAAGTGGLTIYEWYESNVLVQVIIRGNDKPASSFIEGLRFAT